MSLSLLNNIIISSTALHDDAQHDDAQHEAGSPLHLVLRQVVRLPRPPLSHWQQKT